VRVDEPGCDHQPGDVDLTDAVVAGPRVEGVGLDEPQRVVDVYGALFSRPVTADNMQMSLATGESVACLNHLLYRDELVVDTDDAGVRWYRMKNAAAVTSADAA